VDDVLAKFPARNGSTLIRHGGVIRKNSRRTGAAFG
jgi:hypothetical protein